MEARTVHNEFYSVFIFLEYFFENSLVNLVFRCEQKVNFCEVV